MPKSFLQCFNFQEKFNENYIQILTGEDWNVVMYDGIQAYGGIKVQNNYRLATYVGADTFTTCKNIANVFLTNNWRVFINCNIVV